MGLISLFADIFEKKMSRVTIAFLFILLTGCLWAIWMAAAGHLAPAAQPEKTETAAPRHGMVESQPVSTEPY